MTPKAGTKTAYIGSWSFTLTLFALFANTNNRMVVSRSLGVAGTASQRQLLIPFLGTPRQIGRLIVEFGKSSTKRLLTANRPCWILTDIIYPMPRVRQQCAMLCFILTLSALCASR
jgi:hypothetical protein